MLAVLGSFRFPPERIGEALPLMQQVITATLQEAGCRSYCYAHDVSEPGLFRVTEIWESRAALDAHFATLHMRDWAIARDALGFFDRKISLFDLGVSEEL